MQSNSHSAVISHTILDACLAFQISSVPFVLDDLALAREHLGLQSIVTVIIAEDRCSKTHVAAGKVGTDAVSGCTGGLPDIFSISKVAVPAA